MVPDASSRLRVKGVVCHVCSERLPNGTFVQVRDDVYVASPEACLVQMAPRLSFPKALEMGCEFGGLYRRNPCGSPDFKEAKILTDAAALESFIAKVKGAHGIGRARLLPVYLASFAASPRESQLFLLLCLKRNYGGYGLPKSKMNERIDFDGRSKKLTDKNFLRCDLFWSEARLAVEYESDEYHAGSEQIARDSRRRGALQYGGVSVITVTNDQIVDAHKLDEVALLLQRQLGIKHRKETEEWRAAQRNLRRLLLDFDDGLDHVCCE